MGYEVFYSSMLWLYVQENPDGNMRDNRTYPIGIDEYLKKMIIITIYYKKYLTDVRNEIEFAERVMSLSFEDNILYSIIFRD